MGSKTSTLLQETEIADISRETGFTHNQIVRLYSRFTALDKMSNGFLSREDFLRIPELAINPLGDRIVNAFFQENHDEANFRQFMRVLACFRPIKKAESAAAAQSAASMATNGSGAQGTALGTSGEFHSVRATLNSRESKLRFAFDMYDLDQDGYISRDELLSVLQMMVGANISTEQLMSIADRTIAEADEDGDSKISFAEFCKALESCDVEQKMSIKFLN